MLVCSQAFHKTESSKVNQNSRRDFFLTAWNRTDLSVTCLYLAHVMLKPCSQCVMYLPLGRIITRNEKEKVKPKKLHWEQKRLQNANVALFSGIIKTLDMIQKNTILLKILARTLIKEMFSRVLQEP